MNIAELVDTLYEYNPTAKVKIIVNGTPMEFSIAYGSSEGCTKENCDSVSLYVDTLNKSETEN